MRPFEARDLAVLLPRLPVTYAVVGPEDGWPEALERWGSTPARAADAELVVVTAGRSAVDAEVVVQVGSWRRRRAPAGGEVAYYARRGADDVVELHAARRGWRGISVAGRPSAAPAAVVASGRARCTSARISRDPRRRVALFTEDAVIKVPRDPGESGRGLTEQAVLDVLEGIDVTSVPRALGAGAAGPVAWSAETLVPGVPFAIVRDASRTRSLLDAIALWLGTIASRTRGSGSHDRLPLRGPHAAADELGNELAGAVAPVLQHGDLASGLNILVDGTEFSVVDWETARRRGVPLVDLLPVLCAGWARARGEASEADAVLRLCRGDDADSPWLFAHVHRYAASAGVPVDAIGRLATLAWAYQASMRLVHDELVRSAGREPVAWTSSAEHVAAAWADDPDLGTEWPALHRRS